MIELLTRVSFSATPGNVTAILGPSGCGKTTLLNVISDRATSGKVVEGGVYFNGNETRARKIPGGKVALLNANDRLLPYLSVRETLTFTAYLRMPDATKEERRARVDAILRDLALTHAQDTMIGGAWRKGLSSGEMRRCSIAMELMGNPSVLLLDEPTSGLDAVLAYEVVSILKTLAQKGRTVVCTLHQPRSSVGKLLDNVAVMAQGRIIFQGTMDESRQHFLASMGRDISLQGNYADGFLDIASNVPADHLETSRQSSDDVDHGREAGSVSAASYYESYEGSESQSETSRREASRRSVSRLSLEGKHGQAICERAADLYEESQYFRRVQEDIDESVAQKQPINVEKPKRNCVLRYLMQVYGVAFRTFRNSWNNPIAFLMSIVVQLAMGMFLGFIFFRLPYKFLPDQKPMYVGDANSPMMKLMESAPVRFLTEGVDGQGTNPFIDVIVDGVDGKGSDPFQTLFNSTVMYRLANMMPCAHSRLQLGQMTDIYGETDFTDYYKYWSGTGEGFQGLKSGNKFVIGEYNPPAIVSSVLQTLQFADYLFYNLPWRQAHAVCYNNYPDSYIACFGCHSEIGAFLDAASECTEIPEQPTNIMAPCSAKLDLAGVDVFGPDDTYLPNNAGGVRYPTEIPDKPTGKGSLRISSEQLARLRDTIADADTKGRRRRLQISGLMGGGIDLSSVLPGSVAGLIDAWEDYKEALAECTHPVCRKIVEGLNAESTGTSALDYAAVVGAVLNVAGALFFSVASLGFGAYDGLTGLCEDRPLINRELMNNTYKASAYFLGRTIGDFFFHLVPAFCLVTSFYLIVDLDKGPGGLWFARYLLVCLVLCTTAYAFSYFLSSISPSMEVAVIAAPLCLVVLICCSGFFVRDSAIPTSMNWLKYISFYRWGFFALILNQFPHGENYWGVPNSFNLALIGVGETSIWKCIGILIALGCAFRVLAYLGLKYTHRSIGVET
ncbi:ABC transporter [Gregarina niphandrodes]|uniref:ABC transporter n=1 Tax=Gregarina niphandrodes TaxID=110365 RepID=A0A023B3J7_GRENI|nr:ABC transporter [Gregarina niphandrodes]EZG55557.1 ABC transporter [Gregarina niphandrodes]|eukprot:XP_011131497.1 ABC transporter [Gregarina niphandrodes]